MACFSPITAWYAKEGNPSGKTGLVFNPGAAAQPDAPLEIACGQCVGCRLERSRQWAMRCMHEAQRWENNCFLTLTFDEDHLWRRENPGTVDVRDFQLFMKRLRKQEGSNKDNPIRYYHCGEYGDKNGRPHYHAILFNFDPPDKVLHSINQNGDRLYVSERIRKAWPFGYHYLGAVTFESAAYVARYCMKKVNGDEPFIKSRRILDEGSDQWRSVDVVNPGAAEHYTWVNEETGELRDRAPEYATMSRRPGIGAGFFSKYRQQIIDNDFIVMNGKKMRPPKAYDKYLEEYDSDLLQFNKEKRIEKAMQHADNNSPQRLAARERIQKRRAEKLERKL
jgi:hypothetical protein